MKILVIGPIKFEIIEGKIFLSNSGISYCIWGWAHGLEKAGNEVALLPSVSVGNLQLSTIFQKVTLIPGPIKNYKSPIHLSNKWIDIIIKEFGVPDLIHIHDIYVHFNIALARKFNKLDWPYIITPSGSFSPIAQNRKKLKKKIARFFFINHYIKNAKAIHLLSNNEEKHCNNLFPNINKIIIPNGIDSSINDTPNKLTKVYVGGTESKDFIFGYLGRMNIKIKGIDLMLKAIKKIQDEFDNINLKFVFVGPMGDPLYYIKNSKEEIAELHTLLKEMKYPERIIFSDPVFGTNKWHVLRSFDIFFQPSRTEGMPIAVLEAMLMGKPCLVTEGSSMGETINISQGGWVCQTSVNGIYESIKNILNTPKKIIKEKGINAKNYVIKKHDWGTVAEQLISTIQKL